MATFYKLLRVKESILWSVFSDEIGLEYVPGVRVSSDIGPLFIFREARFASKWEHVMHRDRQLWECTATNVRSPPLRIPSCPFDRREVQAFWLSTFPAHVQLIRPPFGTLIADTVTLTQQIH